MSDWAVGLSTGCFYRTSIFECLPLIRDHGFTMLEICSHPDHLDYHDTEMVRRAARRLEAWNLEAYSFHAPFAPGFDITSPVKTHRRRSIDEMLAAVEAAAVLGARYLVLHAGPEKELQPEPGEYLQRRQNVIPALNEIAGRCRAHQMQLVLENMLPHLFCGDISELLRCLGAVREAVAGTCLDTGHAFLSGELFHIATAMAGSLKMIHASDNHGRHDDHLPPGQGRIEWLPLLGHLQKTGFAGGIILELNGDAKTGPESMLREAGQARLYLRRLARRLHNV